MNTQFTVGAYFAGISLIPVGVCLFAATALPYWFYLIGYLGFLLIFIGIFLMAFSNPS